MKYIETIWTPKLIADYARLPSWNGFEGGECSKCHMTVNVPAGGPGWFCECGHYICQYHSGMCRQPHDKPDRGPLPYTIQYGLRIAMMTLPRYHEILTPTSASAFYIRQYVKLVIIAVKNADFCTGFFCFDKGIEALIKTQIKYYRPKDYLFCFSYPKSMESVFQSVSA